MNEIVVQRQAYADLEAATGLDRPEGTPSESRQIWAEKGQTCSIPLLELTRQGTCFSHGVHGQAVRIWGCFDHPSPYGNRGGGINVLPNNNPEKHKF